ncbi:MAG: septal ring lytic transglycosylase RlpA family protein [Desulfobacteraceae bacterium]|nr:septal ring lytic transglycosylase RlpA family protein [Desulfobacteraceae bacterium]
MKINKFIVTLLSMLFLCAACAQRSPYPTTSSRPPKKLIVLPEKGRDPTMRPYMINGERYYPLPDSDGFVQFGKASWYGRKFHGRPTASGEVFDMNKKSAAHKTLPMGTYVKVVNLSNKKELIVMINDRGPFVKGRIIDLSRAAAKEIDLIGPGMAEVKIVALGREVGGLKSPLGTKPVVEIEDVNRGEFTLQVGAFRNKDNALRLVDRLKVIFDHVEVSAYDDHAKQKIYRVWVSRSKTLTKAGEVEKKLEDMGFEEAFIVNL